jgi:hypothetical protein
MSLHYDGDTNNTGKPHPFIVFVILPWLGNRQVLLQLLAARVRLGLRQHREENVDVCSCGSILKINLFLTKGGGNF